MKGSTGPRTVSKLMSWQGLSHGVARFSSLSTDAEETEKHDQKDTLTSVFVAGLFKQRHGSNPKCPIDRGEE